MGLSYEGHGRGGGATYRQTTTGEDTAGTQKSGSEKDSGRINKEKNRKGGRADMKRQK